MYMVSCNKCGMELPEDANYCHKCGNSTAKTKIEENKQQLEEAQKKIDNFESRYHTTFEAFKANFPPDADMESHEDFVEWSFWVDVRDRLNEEINSFKKLNGTQG